MIKEMEIKRLKEEIKIYHKLEAALCEMTKSKRMTFHLCDQLDDLKMIHKKLELELTDIRRQG